MKSVKCPVCHIAVNMMVDGEITNTEKECPGCYFCAKLEVWLQLSLLNSIDQRLRKIENNTNNIPSSIGRIPGMIG